MNSVHQIKNARSFQSDEKIPIITSNEMKISQYVNGKKLFSYPLKNSSPIYRVNDNIKVMV